MDRWMATDLIYHSLRNAIIESYQSGDLANEMGQMEESLSALDDIYDVTRFRSGKIIEAKIKILNEIQTKVDKVMGKKVYSDMWE